MDLGPPADHEEVQKFTLFLSHDVHLLTYNNKANEFRQLWGSKAEIRRFRDGKINEAVGMAL